VKEIVSANCFFSKTTPVKIELFQRINMPPEERMEGMKSKFI